MGVVRNNFLVATRKFSRPWLVVLPAGKTSLRLAQSKKHLFGVFFESAYGCGQE